MRLSVSFIAVSLASVVQANSGQVPVVDGVIGGIGNVSAGTLKASNAAIVTTAGSTRVTENSGVCETTPDVYTASGYVDIANNKSIWFWYFDARKNPDTAPLTLWFNGGPGSSSMIGLFRELGPCRITNDSSTVTLNPWSWNTESNLLFIDQPVGVGFSHGTLDVGTSQKAASDVWQFMQFFLADERFSHLQDRELAIWTESYGGHYGPTFASHFLDQNDAIATGEVEGITLNLRVLGVGDGLTDPLTQYPGYIEYAKSNPYHQLVATSVIDLANTTWSSPTGCKPKITACYDGGSDAICSDAQSFCNSRILSPLAGNWDVYYVLAANPNDYPPDFATWLNSVSANIGAETNWQRSNGQVYSNFAATGDWMRNSRLDLEKVIDAGVRTIVYVGDADYVLNYPGIEAMMDIMETRFSDEYAAQEYESYTVHGEETGLFKNAGTLSYLRIFGAGHEVPAYTYGNLEIGEAAYQMFSQIMRNESLTST